MKSIIKKIISKVMSVFKIKNIIILESHCDYSDNTKSFFEYLIEKEYNKKYKIYWFVNDSKKFKDKKFDNVKFLTMWHNKTKRNIIQWIRYFWIVKNAKFLISNNRALPRLNKKTITVNLNHGSPLKSVKDIKYVPRDLDMYLAASDFLIDICADDTNLDVSQIICVGNPRNDVLFKKTNTIEKLKEFKKYKKIILWLPTFRKQATSDRLDSDFNFPLGLPIIYSMEELNKLNKYLKEKNILLLFKLHPAQDTSYLKATSLTNIKIITDDYLFEKNVDLTELYKITSAMITDYSGVYFDYLLVDKPVGFTLDDYEEYKKNKGFAYENPLEYMAGNHMYNIADLYKFIDEINNGKDPYKRKRNEMKKLFNKYSDSRSSERLAKYLNL